jgi:hypothetical protein
MRKHQQKEQKKNSRRKQELLTQPEIITEIEIITLRSNFPNLKQQARSSNGRRERGPYESRYYRRGSS